MPYGKGTYGKQVGRPKKKKKDEEDIDLKAIAKNRNMSIREIKMYIKNYE